MGLASSWGPLKLAIGLDHGLGLQLFLKCELAWPHGEPAHRPNYNVTLTPLE